MRGYDFHRQKPLYNFIADFFCNELMLAIEIDGDSHLAKREEDKIRQDFLESKGINFLRFSVVEVTSDMKNVLESIGSWIDKNECYYKIEKDTPLPLSRGESNLPLSRGESNLPLSRGESNLPLSRGESNRPLSREENQI